MAAAVAALVGCNAILDIGAPVAPPVDAGADSSVAPGPPADPRSTGDASADVDGAGNAPAPADPAKSTPFDAGAPVSLPFTWDFSEDFASRDPVRARWSYTWSRWNAATRDFDRNLCFQPTTRNWLVGWGVRGSEAPNVLWNSLPNDFIVQDGNVFAPHSAAFTPSYDGGETRIDWYATESGVYAIDAEFGQVGRGAQRVRVSPGRYSAELSDAGTGAWHDGRCLGPCDVVSFFVGTSAPSREPGENTTAIAVRITLLERPDARNLCPTSSVPPVNCVDPCVAPTLSAP